MTEAYFGLILLRTTMFSTTSATETLFLSSVSRLQVVDGMAKGS